MIDSAGGGDSVTKPKNTEPGYATSFTRRWEAFGLRNAPKWFSLLEWTLFLGGVQFFLTKAQTLFELACLTLFYIVSLTFLFLYCFGMTRGIETSRRLQWIKSDTLRELILMLASCAVGGLLINASIAVAQVATRLTQQ